MKLKNVEVIRANKNEIYPLPICPCGTIVSSAPCDDSLVIIQSIKVNGYPVPSGAVFFCLECSLSGKLDIDDGYMQPYFNEDGSVSEYEEVLGRPVWHSVKRKRKQKH
jgi:hypothetical protein